MQKRSLFVLGDDLWNQVNMHNRGQNVELFLSNIVSSQRRKGHLVYNRYAIYTGLPTPVMAYSSQKLPIVVDGVGIPSAL